MCESPMSRRTTAVERARFRENKRPGAGRRDAPRSFQCVSNESAECRRSKFRIDTRCEDNRIEHRIVETLALDADTRLCRYRSAGFRKNRHFVRCLFEDEIRELKCRDCRKTHHIKVGEHDEADLVHVVSSRGMSGINCIYDV